MSLSLSDLSVIAPLLMVFSWATALLLVDLFFIPKEEKRITGYLALAGLIAAGGIALPLWGMNKTAFGGMVTVDRFSLILTWIFLLAALISTLLALDYLPRQGIEQGEFYPLLLYATGGMLLLAQSTNLITIFLGIELLSITLYVLVAFAYPQPASEEAAMKYLLLGAFATGFLVYGIALIYGATNTVDLAAINTFAVIEQGIYQKSYQLTLLLAGCSLVLVAFSFKIALVPFHMWTPDVYEGAPTPVTAFMSVGTKGAALAALLRILTLALPVLRPYWMPALAALAILTMLVGNIGALAQMNLKRMLAYSSIGHAGYLVLAVISANERGMQGLLFYLLAYTLTNLGAFAVIIALEQKGELAWNLDDLNGLWKRDSNLALAMAVFMLSLAGVPPTAGFVAKFYIFTAAWESGLQILAIIGVLSSAIAAFFYLRVIVRMFMVEPATEPRPILLYDSLALALSIALATIATLLFGIFPTPLFNLVQQTLIASGG